MGYDPQARRRRPRPDTSQPAPIDGLLGTAPPPTPTIDDPPPAPGVTPDPADPVPDAVVVSTGMAAAAAAFIGLVTLRWLWLRRRRSQPLDD